MKKKKKEKKKGKQCLYYKSLFRNKTRKKGDTKIPIPKHNKQQFKNGSSCKIRNTTKENNWPYKGIQTINLHSVAMIKLYKLPRGSALDQQQQYQNYII